MKRIFRATVIVGTMVLISCASTPPVTNEFNISDEFVEYIKTTVNPYEWGLRDNGRFYPYSRPGGRMIGYGQSVFDKKYYSQGMSKEEAENNLRNGLEKTLTDLRQYLITHYPEHPFDQLSSKSQEILLDHAYSTGPENLSDEFYSAVIKQDWDKLFNEFLYIRWIEKGWPKNIANKAFANRWLDPETRQIPNTNAISKILNKGSLEK